MNAAVRDAISRSHETRNGGRRRRSSPDGRRPTSPSLNGPSWTESRAHGPAHRAETTLACSLLSTCKACCLSPFPPSAPSALLRRRRARPREPPRRRRFAAMGSMTIGAKYKTTIKDPGTPGILRMVRATLSSPSPFPPTPRGSPSPPHPSLSSRRARTAR